LALPVTAPIFHDARYPEMAARRREEYVKAEPFPHIVIDDFLPRDVAERLVGEYPRPGSIEWIRFHDASGLKLATRNEIQMPEFTRTILAQLNSATFLQWLETLTSINGLVPDPYLEGGGLHQIERGGFLKIHADFNLHPRLRLDRRLNLLLYLNPDWKEDYGGHLELWNRTMTKCERKILPAFNRCVIFSTTDWAYHGHPEPLLCPEEMTRKSLALYYYSNGRPAEERSAEHTTLYQYRPGEAGASRRLSRSGRRFCFKLFSWLAERFRPPLY
jgi:2OG-Fe(II) oxygenase superfamily